MFDISECLEKVDIVFILDASGSVQAKNFNTMKQFVKDFVEEIDIDSGIARIGIMTFSNSEKIEFHLNIYNNRLNMINAIDDIRYLRGSTNTASALRYLRETMFTDSNGDRTAARNVAILITDGQSNDHTRTVQEAMKVRDSGIHMFVAGVGNWLDEQELNAIASYPERDNVFRLDSFNLLNENFHRRLRELACNSNIYF